jgi:hypothetical protein
MVEQWGEEIAIIARNVPKLSSFLAHEVFH